MFFHLKEFFLIFVVSPILWQDLFIVAIALKSM